MSSLSFSNCSVSEPSQTQQYCILLNTYTDCNNKMRQQEILSAPMYWIGIYITAASLVCTILMAADVILGFRQLKLWLPCIYFTLNAASLTLLGVAMKLPVDLTSSMPGKIDQLAKLSSTAFMCTAMANFMPSLGPMDSKELLLNVTALGIMVMTMLVNIDIQIRTGAIFSFVVFHNIVRSCMFVLFVVIGSSALKVPIFKNILQEKYDEKHKMSSNERTENFGVEELKMNVKRYWMMAESGGLQFVMASCVTCSASGAICFVTSLIFVGASMTIFVSDDWKSFDLSDYKRSTFMIFLIQSAGVVVGTIAPACRWVTATSFKKGNNNGIFRIQKYWIQRLVEWKQSHIGLKHRSRKCRKVVQGGKNIILYIFIGVQIVIVVLSNMVRLFPILFVRVVSRSCRKPNEGNHRMSEDSEREICEVVLGDYVLRLEGEEELPKRVLKNISDSVNQLIEKARRKQPKNLMGLLKKSILLTGSDKVQPLRFDDPPNCWSLTVVTLTSIAIALPNIKNDTGGQLLRSVSEGFSFVRLIEKSLDTKGNLATIRKAADVVWLTLKLDQKWLNEDLMKMALEKTTTMEYLQGLSDAGQRLVMTLNKNMNGGREENPLNWPVNVIAANSMYKISRTILSGYEDSNDQTFENLFKQLSVMIADILVACFTNLPRVILTKCYCSDIAKREQSVQQAARLFGETEGILKILQQSKLPDVDPDQAAYIDERGAGAILESRNHQASVPSFNKESTSFGFGLGSFFHTTPRDGNNQDYMSVFDWIKDNIWDNPMHNGQTLFISALWHIWTARNKRIFDKVNISPNMVWANSNSLARELDYIVKTKISPNYVQDIIPNYPSSVYSLSGYEIFIDGSYDPFSKLGGFGGMVSSNEQRWIIGFSCKIISDSNPIKAELVGILHGLNMARIKGWKGCLLRSDCLEAVKFLNRRDHQNHPLTSIIEECMTIMTEMEIEVSHIRRSNNIWVDGLARIGRRQVNDYTEYDEIPESLFCLLEYGDKGKTKVALQACTDQTYRIATFEGYVLDDQGQWKAGYYGRLKGTPSLIRALIKGLFHGLNMAKMRGWKDIMVETTSHELIDIFKGVQYRETNFENIRVDCYELMRVVGADFIYVSPIMVQGEDWLAREAKVQEETFVEIEEIPATMRRILTM